MKTRILVIEDNPANLELMLYLLRAYGLEAVGSPTGTEGLEQAKTGDFDLILCDIQLPDIDGIEIAAQLKLHRKAPLVAVTALAMIGDRDRLLASGFDGYISKPLDPQSFVPSVEAFLLPSARQPRSMPPSDAAPGVAHQVDPSLVRSETILIVDDTDENRYLLKTILQARGFQVIEAASVADGVRKAQETLPQMIICDVNMPLEDGEKFLARAKVHPDIAKIPVLMVTSSDKPSQQTRERLSAAGAVGLLVRPVETAVLLETIEAQLSRAKM
jgi:CheY-like chemotaxis protein